MTKKMNMSNPVGEVAKRRGEGVRQLVFALTVTSAAALGFFPSGHLDMRLVTQAAMRLSEGWQDILGHTTRNLPKFQFED